MRLIAVPLARARPSSQPLSTFVAQTASRAAEKAVAAAAKDGATSGVPFTTRMLNKASAFWIDLGRTDQTSTFDWKRRTYTAGEKLMDRIEYQEWALKGIDPALGPHLMSKESKEIQDKDHNGIPKLNHIPLLYPPSFLKPEPLLSSLKNLTDHRTPHHYRRFWYCVVGMPITIPFALVPVIPNLPFFYLVYRAWSHWKAYKSSKYLSALIAQDRVHPTESKELDSIFLQKTTSSNPEPRSVASTEPTSPAKPTVPAGVDERVILLSHHIPLLMEAMEFPDWVQADLRRARLQVERAISESRLDQLESEAERVEPTKDGKQ
ncbi:hypothetical protein BCV70DRAFT_196871 [Testicularia cyperi]|uniref:Mitochondrial K+-H+ exchange-related-domain-containing protein n=1 Tax=Testicularia cyperi TaxID=1882483 RepID=A0A317XXL4_9BASI|nr:hypothetical protein BCV70DRAFT_196871 [Testicularia cyperi]